MAAAQRVQWIPTATRRRQPGGHAPTGLIGLCVHLCFRCSACHLIAHAFGACRERHGRRAQRAVAPGCGLCAAAGRRGRVMDNQTHGSGGGAQSASPQMRLPNANVWEAQAPLPCSGSRSEAAKRPSSRAAAPPQAGAAAAAATVRQSACPAGGACRGARGCHAAIREAREKAVAWSRRLRRPCRRCCARRAGRGVPRPAVACSP